MWYFCPIPTDISLFPIVIFSSHCLFISFCSVPLLFHTFFHLIFLGFWHQQQQSFLFIKMEAIQKYSCGGWHYLAALFPWSQVGWLKDLADALQQSMAQAKTNKEKKPQPGWNGRLLSLLWLNRSNVVFSITTTLTSPIWPVQNLKACVRWKGTATNLTYQKLQSQILW
jgi:hypothetical protein